VQGLVDWIPIGRLRRTRGRKGELAGEIYSSRPGRADALKDVVLESQGRRRDAVVERIWFHDGAPVFKFAGIDTISDAELWEGADILVSPEERLTPEAGEFTHAELIGCAVLDAAGNKLGTVAKVEEFGGPALLNVTAADGRELLVPFARSICREIDVAGKLIRVDLPEGLTEL
jgi:16S rRNA processing protein RimM